MNPIIAADYLQGLFRANYKYHQIVRSNFSPFFVVVVVDALENQLKKKPKCFEIGIGFLN